MRFSIAGQLMYEGVVANGRMWIVSVHLIKLNAHHLLSSYRRRDYVLWFHAYFDIRYVHLCRYHGRRCYRIYISALHLIEVCQRHIPPCMFGLRSVVVIGNSLQLMWYREYRVYWIIQWANGLIIQTHWYILEIQ